MKHSTVVCIDCSCYLSFTQFLSIAKREGGWRQSFDCSWFSTVPQHCKGRGGGGGGVTSDYSCPLGRWVLKYRLFFFFFFSVTIISNHVMCFFLSWANSRARCTGRCFVAEFFQVYIVFLVVAIFAKTECYSPSNLLVRSATYRTSAMYQLSTCPKWCMASFQAFHDYFSHETYKHHASTVTCSGSKWKNPPGQNDHSRQKQTTCWEYYVISIIILGMSKLAVPVLLLMVFTSFGADCWMNFSNKSFFMDSSRFIMCKTVFWKELNKWSHMEPV